MPPNVQRIDVSCSDGSSVVVNITLSPTVAFRGPSGNTPAPLVKPGTKVTGLRTALIIGVHLEMGCSDNILNQKHNHTNPQDLVVEFLRCAKMD